VRKYRNKPQEIDGIRFDSKAEAKRYGELMIRQKAGEITDLKVHPPYWLTVNGIEICKYVGDFAYWTNDGDDRQYILEDVKGVKTRLYMLKKKLVLACLGINITEIKVAR
jgi:hypothetical protein